MPLRHDLRLFWLALLAGLPAVVVAMVLLWTGSFSARLDWTLTLLVVGFWLGCAEALRGRVVFPLQTLSNLLAALREGDFSLRARGARHDDALGEVLFEINSLGATLREQRLGALEATALLEKVMAEVDIAVFGFNPDRQLHLINRAGERLLGGTREALIGQSARALGLAACLSGEPARTLHLQLPGGAGGWDMRRGQFREGGRAHQLLVMTDLSRALREEERQAWQRLIRVLGHELNNSLAPIHSLANSLAALLNHAPEPPDWRQDMKHGLAIISGRAEALSRFMSAYTRWARLPKPKIRPMHLEPLVRRVAELETRLNVHVQLGPDLLLMVDPDQLEQALINLVKNAADAVLEMRRVEPGEAQDPAARSEAFSESAGNGARGWPLQTGRDAARPAVRLAWRQTDRRVEITVDDDGPGLASLQNLFVPFFTTKPDGSGIGLLVSRQIAEAHGGNLFLQNRPEGGCQARLLLPLQSSALQ